MVQLTLMNSPRSLMMLLSFLFFAIPFSVQAEVTISEIMYDAEGSDNDREWIELSNNGGENIELAGWKVNDGANHVLNEPPKNGGQGMLTIEPHSSIILADNASVFLSEYRLSGTVVDTTFSFKNTSGTISLVDTEGAVIDTVSFDKAMGGAGDGMSLQRRGQGWVASPPTPGGVQIPATTGTPTPPSASKKADANTKPPSTPSAASSVAAPASHEFAVRIETPGAAIAGDSVTFVAQIGGMSNTVRDEHVQWNFGDGTTGIGQSIEHVYERPGTYVVVCMVTKEGGEARARATVVAEHAPIHIAQVNPGPDGFLIIRNNSKFEIDISGWRLQADNTTFRLPAGTILLADTEVVFGARTTGLVIVHPETVALLFPTGKVVARFEDEGEDEPKKTSTIEISPVSPTSESGISEDLGVSIDTSSAEGSHDEALLPNESPVFAQTANVIENNEGSGSLLPWLASLAALLFVAVSATFLARRSDVATASTDEVETYTIIDEDDEE
jgi:plastocyanin